MILQSRPLWPLMSRKRVRQGGLPHGLTTAWATYSHIRIRLRIRPAAFTSAIDRKMLKNSRWVFNWIWFVCVGTDPDTTVATLHRSYPTATFDLLLGAWLVAHFAVANSNFTTRRVVDDARATTLKPVRNPSSIATLSTPGNTRPESVCCPINICHIMRKSIETFSTGQLSFLPLLLFHLFSLSSPCFGSFPWLDFN